jgi:cytochrome c biogenesis protein CcmG/thiol:disulfide interchange protein DsbE
MGIRNWLDNPSHCQYTSLLDYNKMPKSSRKAYILASALILLVAAGWIWWSRAAAGNTTGGTLPLPRQGFSAPDFSLQTPGGETYTLADLRGKPVLINLWTSWCPPCRAEMPALERVYKEYRDQGFEILAVNSTSQDNQQDAVSFAEELGLTFPILLDPTGEISHLYQLSSLPTSFFVGKDGVIREVVVGGPMSEALLRIRVQQLMEEQ